MNPNIPILKNIRVNSKKSEETPCFKATLIFEGKTFQVSNEGRGGANDYHPSLSREMESRLDEWAAANNEPYTEYGMNLPCNFETWTFGKAFELCAF